MTQTQYDRAVVKITSPEGGLAEKLKTAQIRELYGREQISQLFHFNIHLVSPTGIQHLDLLDAPIKLYMDRKEQTGVQRIDREVLGIVSAVRDRMAGGIWGHQYHLEMVPVLWKTTLTTATDIFQNLSVPEVISKILTEQYGWQEGKQFEMRLNKGAYPKREYIVQYDETHLNFISRLAEHVGIFFFFEHPPDAPHETVVFGDATAHFQKAYPDKALYLARGDETHVFALEAAVRQRSSKVRVRDYNYRTPQVELAADSEFDKGAGGAINEFGANFDTVDDARRTAKIRAEREEVQYLTFDGRSDYPGFRAGSVVKIEEHPAPVVADKPLLLTEVIHVAVQPVHGWGDGPTRSYENEFRAVPNDLTYRPPRLAQKRQVPGLLTAIVESEKKDGEKLGAIDETGRYRVNFHVDSRLNLKSAADREPAKASLPIRMAQPSAGADRKLHLPLKHGTEVVVACINGDPDRPVILGAVPDLGPKSGKGYRGSPVTQENKEKLILKTNISELSIDDTEGKARWRTQVGNAAHVHLIGEPEHEKGVATHIPEKGHGIASEDNFTATVNKGLTFESTDLTALQQVQTLLTATRTLDFTGEDPGWEDWQKFEQAVAKAVEFKRLLNEMTATGKQRQSERAAARTRVATEEHHQVQNETIDGMNQDRAKQGQAPLRHDPQSSESEEQWRDDTVAAERQRNDAAAPRASAEAERACENERRLDKELDALHDQQQASVKRLREAQARRKEAEVKLRDAERRKSQARKRLSSSRISGAERSTAQADQQGATADANAASGAVQAAKAEEEQALESAPSAAQLEAKKKDVDEACRTCRQARERDRQEQQKRAQLQKVEKAQQKKDRAAAGEKKVADFWKSIDAQVKEGPAAEVTALDKAPEVKEPDKKDLWSKIAKELSDKAHEKHLTDTKSVLDDAKASLEASTERDAADAGAFQEPYSIRIAKDSAGLLAHTNLFMYGDKHATLYSHENTHVVSGDRASLKAEKGVEVASDDWIKITTTKTIDINSNQDIKLVADSAENKAMPGGHSMLFFSNKGINMESATGMIEGKAMKSIELTADMAGIKLTANLANIDMTASAGQLKGMGTAGISFSTPAMITASAGGAQTHSAGGAITVSAGGAYTALAGGAVTITAGAAATFAAGAAATVAAGGVVTIAGTGLILI